MTFTLKVNRYDEISYSKGNVKDLALIQKRIIFEKPGRVFSRRSSSTFLSQPCNVATTSY